MNMCVEQSATLVERFVLAQQSFEGWYLPGQIVNGVSYPKGSRSFQNNNPCNFKTRDADPALAGIQPTPYLKSLGALGADAGHFCIFPTYHDGFMAGCTFLQDVIANTIIPYRAAALKLGLPDAGQLSVLQFFQVYAPSDDGNFPAKYAAAVAAAVGILVTQPMNLLVVPHPGTIPPLAMDFSATEDTKVDDDSQEKTQ